MLKSKITDSGTGKNLIARPKITASKKFMLEPAMPTFRLPHLWSFKLNGFIGTGFAQPIIGPLPWVKTKRIIGRMIVPNISICFNGFKVRRPAFFAVGSPKRKATDPWAISCKTIEKNKTMRENIVNIIVS